MPRGLWMVVEAGVGAQTPGEAHVRPALDHGPDQVTAALVEGAHAGHGGVDLGEGAADLLLGGPVVGGAEVDGGEPVAPVGPAADHGEVFADLAGECVEDIGVGGLRGVPHFDPSQGAPFPLARSGSATRPLATRSSPLIPSPGKISRGAPRRLDLA